MAGLLFSPGADLFLSSDDLALLSLPSSVVAAPSAGAASVVAPYAATASPSTVSVSSFFSGSTNIVGAATVAITKSLSVIVGMTFSGRLPDDILRLVLI